MAANNDRVRIFDTTLRDGEQSPGATMTSDEKLEVARMLARLGVDIIEAGFPIASPDDFQAVRRIADEVGATNGSHPPPVICGLARANEKISMPHGKPCERQHIRASTLSWRHPKFT